MCVNVSGWVCLKCNRGHKRGIRKYHLLLDTSSSETVPLPEPGTLFSQAGSVQGPQHLVSSARELGLQHAWNDCLIVWLLESNSRPHDCKGSALNNRAISPTLT